MKNGREKLLSVLEKTHTNYMAKRCHVTPNAVYNWRAGRNGPGLRAREALEYIYGIEGKEWKR